MGRHELTVEQYLVLEPYPPKPVPAGAHPWTEYHRILREHFNRLLG
jgi:hypothetical protein